MKKKKAWDEAAADFIEKRGKRWYIWGSARKVPGWRTPEKQTTTTKIKIEFILLSGSLEHKWIRLIGHLQVSLGNFHNGYV